VYEKLPTREKIIAQGEAECNNFFMGWTSRDGKKNILKQQSWNLSSADIYI
jgi:hypothetical protein